MLYVLYSRASSRNVIYTLSYTTLFRSVDLQTQRIAVENQLEEAARSEQRLQASLQNLPEIQIQHATINAHYESLKTRRELQTDRKSTRLNSSHRCISYAVFCLKKKIIH